MRGNETFGDLLKASLNGNESAMNCVLQQIDPIVRYNSNEKDVLRRINESIWSFFCENAEKYGFESREGQQDMALDIGQAIADKHHLIVEAGVGIGKSFAYIVPLMYFRKNFRRPVIISTSTIALQEQLRGDIFNRCGFKQFLHLEI